MRVAFFVREIMPEGGVTLATFRLAAALTELGHESKVLFCAGEPPDALRSFGRRIESAIEGDSSPGALRRSLERCNSDVVVVGSGRAEDLLTATEVAPTLLHAHLHMGTCPDLARYWSRLSQPCGVNAGWHCAALRPLLGCSELGRSVRPGPIRSQQKLLGVLSKSGVGVLSVSTSQAELFAKHGVPRSRIAVLPNLGIRATASELSAAGELTPEHWRSATAFIGRLSKPKGAKLLGGLAGSLPPDARLRVFGEGYLSGKLSSLPGEALCGHVTQDQVTGVMMWARAVVFPSLWPEPGGIVGIDAQVMGIPLAAFDTGAAQHWPGARRFAVRDAAGMARWLAARKPRSVARDPDEVEQAQKTYWDQIACHGANALSAFREGRAFKPDVGLPAESLMRGPESENRVGA